MPRNRLKRRERRRVGVRRRARGGAIKLLRSSRPRRHARFIDGDQRRHRREGQLEARAHDRFRLEAE